MSYVTCATYRFFSRFLRKYPYCGLGTRPLKELTCN